MEPHSIMPEDQHATRGRDVTSAQPGEGDERPCTIIGPANSGKTTLLLAMQQSCFQNEVAQEESLHDRSQYKLDFVPESDTAADLMSLAGEFLFNGKTVRATRDVTNYSFRIFVNNLTHQEREHSCRLTVTDGPGGHLFPSERGAAYMGVQVSNELLQSARQASSLVLCVDGSAPALETLYHGLPKLILDLKGSARRLPYRRVLLLITKVDRIIGEFFATARRYNEHVRARSGHVNPLLETLGTFSPLCAAKMARMIHPTEQGRQLFGRLIDMMQAGIDANATFAVGVCSALGFHTQVGSTFVDGLPEKGGSGAGHISSRLRNWEPFGVREAILFLAADEIRQPILEVPRVGASGLAKFKKVGVPLHV